MSGRAQLRLVGGLCVSGNPARSSPVLQSLFPPGVSAAELQLPGEPPRLAAAGATGLGRTTSRRTGEFAAGRLCVRRAVENLGLAAFPLAMGQDRCPLWPAALTGSITYTGGYCGAVVAEWRRFHAIGVDAQRASRITPELWEQLFAPEEIAWLERLYPADQRRWASLLFAVKQAFSKCQYTLSRQCLEFDAVAVALLRSGPAAGHFTVYPRTRLALTAHHPAPYRGQFRFDRELVFAGMALP
jgi:4'-phosphopantetheinyl transferase EntD